MAYGQCQFCPELISNPDITVDYNMTTPMNNGNQSFGRLPIESAVEGWFSTYRTPHHIQYINGSICTKNPLVPLIPNNSIIKNCIESTSNNVNNEGFHANIDIINNQYLTYCIKVNYQRLNCPNTTYSNSHLAIRFAIDGPSLSNNSKSPPDENYDLDNNLDPYTIYLIGNPEVNDNDEHIFARNLLPSNDFPGLDFNQFQIFAHGGNSLISINNASITCQTTALTGINATTNLPNNCGLTWNFSPIIDHNGCSLDRETYEWTIRPSNSELPISTFTDATYTFDQPGNYTVCLKYTDCYGCCATVCREIRVIDCGCAPKPGFTELDATGGVNISDFFGSQNNFSGAKWLVKGNLIINQNTTIDNSIIEFDENARITVNGVYFSIQNRTLLQNGCDKMWDGIFYNQFGFFKILNSTIRDAEDALSISGSARVELVDNIFERNFNCINVSNATNPIRGFRSNTLDGSITLINPRNGQLGENGIVGNDVGTLNVTPSATTITSTRNTFKNLKFAIDLERYRNLYCDNNDFNDMRTESTTIDLTRQMVGGVTTLRKNNFLNGNQGIDMDYCDGSAIIKHNEFYNYKKFQATEGFCIRGKDCNNLTLTIDEINLFKNSTAGIILNGINGGEVKVANNKFESINTNISFDRILPICKIENNEFKLVLTNTINVFSSPKLFVRKNTILANNRAGIIVTDCPNANVSDNEISNGSEKSLDIISCENFIAECNVLTSCVRGINISRVFEKGTIKTNELSNIVMEYLRILNSSLGTQDKYGNKFIGTNTVAKLGGSDLSSNRFLYRNSSLPPGERWRPAQTWVDNSLSNQWFVETPFGENETCEPFAAVTSGTSIAQLENIVNGNVLNNMYYDQNLWSSHWYVLHEIEKNPSLLNTSTTLSNFYNGLTPAKLYYDLNKSISHLYDFTSFEQSQMNNFSNLLSIKMTELETLESLTNEQNFDQYQNAIITKNNEILGVLAEAKIIIDNVGIRAKTNALQLKSTVTNLSETLYFCDENKVGYQARLDEILHGQDYVKNVHGPSLVSIAEKCHLDFGYAVYQAASLCNQLNIPFTESDCSLPESRSLEKINIESNRISIYPNPSNGLLNINSSLPIIYYSISNLDGQKVIDKEIENFTPITIDIQSLNRGIYFLKIKDNQGTWYTQKVLKL